MIQKQLKYGQMGQFGGGGGGRIENPKKKTSGVFGQEEIS